MNSADEDLVKQQEAFSRFVQVVEASETKFCWASFGW